MRGHWRILLVVPLLAIAGGLLWWRGPDWHAAKDAFIAVRWRWVVVAILLNLLSVVSRSIAWDTTIRQSVMRPFPRYRLVFSAFCVGLFANAVLPGRVGELARVAVLRRRMPGRPGTTATLVGSVFAHRMFDVFPALTLVVWVLFAAEIPSWAYTTLAAALGLGIVLFGVGWLLARREGHDALEGMGRTRRLIARGRQGLAVMRSPVAAAQATAFQFGGWGCQLLAVWAALRAFDIHEGVAAAGLVLVLMNVATIFPFWPGNIGLVQIAVATSLVKYGVAYAHGIAFGIGLQAIEASVGIGVGLIFLAREGMSYTTLKGFEPGGRGSASDGARGQEVDHPRSRVAG